MRRIVPIIALLIAAAFHTGALACSCRPLANAAEHAGQADTVFRGRVLTSIPDPADPEAFAVTTFEVTAPLKMLPRWSHPDTITVRHASRREGPECSIWYEDGQEALVVARIGGDGYLYTSSCDAPRWPENDYRAALFLAPVP
ncbi:MAG: hypothetical protein KF910_12390 [Brevundimonas sp.]|uniref:hypothetical protein n=1 Tax=Brevundimonas sp. TaxID=1871086 RepID=UPI0025BBF763|nr:hypothetical protein [Brevundimonas sp.]MBX3478404.1 hypothetical protein [Brevundimonas sp.]